MLGARSFLLSPGSVSTRTSLFTQYTILHLQALDLLSEANLDSDK